MPRKTRIRIVGRIERREAEARRRELQELAAELHQAWRQREALADETIDRAVELDGDDD